MKEKLYNYIRKVSDVSLKISFPVFIIGSIGDIITTWIGFSRGFEERSPIVEFLMLEMGTLLGVIMSKILALVVIVGISYGTNPIYKILTNDEISREELIDEKVIMSDLFLIAGLIYFIATLNNIIVIYF